MPETTYPDSFAEYPKSVGSIRADRAGDGALLSPRDALIDLLREIDRGEVDPYAIFISFGEKVEGGSKTYYRVGGKASSHEYIGIAARAQHMMLRDMDE